MANQIKIQQVKGVAGSSQHQRRVLRALGLRRREHTVMHYDTPQIRGMINKVFHMVKVIEG
ncbi:MAG: 50S ribosomal protein L30 [candidate division Zixibacteria bacterium]|nr:50S ribosomal protein L30 [candidate division Zixibacteria bacterium]